MKPDIYTKAVRTVIAIMLSVVALKPLISLETTAKAQATAGATGVLFSHATFGPPFFDPRTGEFSGGLS